MKNPRKEVNAVLKKEAAYFGDIVILPFMDRYELVVLKTIAICEFGVSFCIISFIEHVPGASVGLGPHAELCYILKAQTFSMQVQNLTAAYIMKCDDDTFVRVDTVLKEIEGISPNKSLYMGNLNLLHRPLRNGKWAVTYEVC